MNKRYEFHLLVGSYLLGLFIVKPAVSFMILNVFLAWIPITLGQLIIYSKKREMQLLLIPWLAFFPNVPYLMTDLFHLANLGVYRPEGLFVDASGAWWNYFFLLVPIIFMVTIGMYQVFQLFRTLSLSRRAQVFLFLILAVLSSVAIYIGRFDRIHSIELIIHPLTVLKTLFLQWSSGKGQFVLLFTLLQLIIWRLLAVFQKEAVQQ